MSQIDGLIDKQDTFEIVGAQIAAILVTETAAQQVLAAAASKDPALWKLRIFSERSNPWEMFRDDPVDRSPVVNVAYDVSNFDGSASTISERQKADAVYNIDCYGTAVAADDGGTGHLPGDREAAFACHRAVRLVRNILMAAPYTYLGLRRTVWKRWPGTISVFQPEFEGVPIPQVVGARLNFQVQFNESAPQVEPEDLDLIAVEVTEDGEVVIEAEYEATP